MKALIAIQDGQISLSQIKALEQIIRRLYAQYVGPQKVMLIWNVADARHTITDRAWSKSSTFSIAVPAGLSGETRQAFLLALDDQWRAVTGQHPDQTAFVAFDKSRFDEVLRGNLERFSPLGRVQYLARTIGRLCLSKLRHGVLIARFNQ